MILYFVLISFRQQNGLAQKQIFVRTFLDVTPKNLERKRMLKFSVNRGVQTFEAH